MLIHKNITVTFDIKSREDLPKLRTFMKVNNLKINKSEVARQLNLDRRTVAKYLFSIQKPRYFTIEKFCGNISRTITEWIYRCRRSTII